MENPLIATAVMAACIVGLWFGAVWVVDSATRIARRIGVSDLVIGLTVVAIGTSAPEFAVTISAALGGSADISVGNVIGSNIFNLGFILGGLALAVGIVTSRPLVYRDGSVLVSTAVLLIVFMWDLQITRIEGIILLAILFTYIGYLIYKREGPDEELAEGDFSWKDIPLFILGVVVVVASGHFFVEAASEMAHFFGISEWVIGVTIVAFGTSAPEIATSGVALLRGQSGMSAGNLIGSDLFNLLGVLGVAAVLAPGGEMIVDVGAQESTFALLFMCVLVVIFMRTGWKVARWEGALLVLIGVIRWVADFSGVSLISLLTGGG